MKFLLFFAAGLVLLQTVTSLPSAPKGDPIKAIEGLVSRILSPEWVDKFTYEIIPATDDGFDVFEVDTNTTANKPVFRGNNGVALASAFNYYLKYYCYCSISWGRNGTGDQLKLPSPLPLPSKVERIVFPNKYRYYQNVCTVSYSMVWWNWTRWEREIDWMAMNGLNLILSFTGQEFVWEALYTEVYLTTDELNKFFAGPAFLAWQRMGNIHGWAGPLDTGWFFQQQHLQARILNQTQTFGMINVLPGFSGHVPEGLKRVFPDINFTRAAQWNRFGTQYSEGYLLEPTDPLFGKLASQFYEILHYVYKYDTDHVYNVDTYNEMEPSSTDLNFLKESNAAIFNAMKKSDPNATFLMQGWLFREENFWTNERIEAYLSGVPNDSMIILDLNTEQFPIWSRTKSYFGKPFIWCLLHNRGGMRALYGNLTTIANNPIDARQAPGSTMVGVGMTPEAIEHNPVMYDLMGEMSWRSKKVDLVLSWVEDYARRRYGILTDNLKNAWSLLVEGAYQFHWSADIKSLLVRHPKFKLIIDKRFATFKIAQAWNYMVTDAIADTQPKAGPLLYDIVDIGRQVIVNTFADVYAIYTNAYTAYTNKKDPNVHTAMKDLAESWMKMFDDLDSLLGSNINFLLGTWIDDARKTTTPSSPSSFVNLLEYNARNQITMWGPNENIEDYAAKEWSGLVSDYYAHRWKLFIDMIEDSIVSNKPFNDSAYESTLFTFEKGWDEKIEAYPTTPTGDTLEISNKLLQKYFRDSDFIKANYVSKMDADIPSDDLYGGPVNLWANATEQYVVLCEMNPSCVGFSFNYDKASKMVSFKTKFDGETTAKGRMLFVKDNIF